MIYNINIKYIYLIIKFYETLHFWEIESKNSNMNLINYEFYTYFIYIKIWLNNW